MNPPVEAYEINDKDDERRICSFLERFYGLLILLGIPVGAGVYVLVPSKVVSVTLIVAGMLGMAIYYYWRIQKLTWHLGMAE